MRNDRSRAQRAALLLPQGTPGDERRVHHDRIRPWQVRVERIASVYRYVNAVPIRPVVGRMLEHEPCHRYRGRGNIETTHDDPAPKLPLFQHSERLVQNGSRSARRVQDRQDFAFLNVLDGPQGLFRQHPSKPRRRKVRSPMRDEMRACRLDVAEQIRCRRPRQGKMRLLKDGAPGVAHREARKQFEVRTVARSNRELNQRFHGILGKVGQHVALRGRRAPCLFPIAAHMRYQFLEELQEALRGVLVLDSRVCNERADLPEYIEQMVDYRVARTNLVPRQEGMERFEIGYEDGDWKFAGRGGRSHRVTYTLPSVTAT